jgi:hypothetical protein
MVKIWPKRAAYVIKYNEVTEIYPVEVAVLHAEGRNNFLWWSTTDSFHIFIWPLLNNNTVQSLDCCWVRQEDCMITRRGLWVNNDFTHLYWHLPAMKEHIMYKEFRFQFKCGSVEAITRRANARNVEWKRALCQMPVEVLSILRLSGLWMLWFNRVFEKRGNYVDD